MPQLNDVQNYALEIVDYLYFYDIATLETYTKIKKKWIFTHPKNLKSTYKSPKSKRRYPNNQPEVYMNGISMYFLISSALDSDNAL